MKEWRGLSLVDSESTRKTRGTWIELVKEGISCATSIFTSSRARCPYKL